MLLYKIREMQNNRRHFHRNNFEFDLQNLFFSMILILFLLRISCDLNNESFDMNQSRSINLISSLSCNGKTLTTKSRSRRRPTKIINRFQFNFQQCLHTNGIVIRCD
jgi:hypothetical protein